MHISLEPKLIQALQADIEITLLDEKTLKKDPDTDLLISIGFKAEHGSIQHLPEKRRLLVGIEKRETQSMQIIASKVVKELQKYRYITVKLDSTFFNEAAELKAFTEGAILGAYSFTKYKSKPQEITLKELTISCDQSDYESYNKHIDEALIIAQATNFTRDIVNTTPEELYPKQMAKIASDLAKEVGLKCDVLGEDQFLDEGMEAMYMVGRASRHDSQLIHLSHKPKNPKATITLVGKGLTYDSGGLSLKPADSMVTMKLDKSGGAAVIGIMKAAALLDLPIEIHGFIGAVENMIGGDAYKPDDVLTAKNGTTIEVRNTDAEG
ncbi:MAG: leucyl aminopeptidase, partial [Thiovulaceae bacterium]|nr:leucyl aminopeptidase [Sulfurimonadaceae bacterium]